MAAMTDASEPIQVTAEVGKVLVDVEAAGGVCSVTLTMREALTLAEKLLHAVAEADLAQRGGERSTH